MHFQQGNLGACNYNHRFSVIGADSWAAWCASSVGGAISWTQTSALPGVCVFGNPNPEGPDFWESPRQQPGSASPNCSHFWMKIGRDCDFSGLGQSNEPSSASGKQFGNLRKWLETCRTWVPLHSVLTFPFLCNFAAVSLLPGSLQFILHSKPIYIKPVTLFRSNGPAAYLFPYVFLIFNLLFLF